MFSGPQYHQEVIFGNFFWDILFGKFAGFSQAYPYRLKGTFGGQLVSKKSCAVLKTILPECFRSEMGPKTKKGKSMKQCIWGLQRVGSNF